MSCRLFVLSLLIVFVTESCRQKEQRFNADVIPPSGEYLNGFKPDSSDLYAVLKFDTVNTRYVFPKTFKPAELNEVEMKIIDSLITVAVNQNNQEYKKDSPLRIMALKNYRRQLVAVIDTNGNKQVYIDAFVGWAYFERSWKKCLAMVSDGGAGYFRLYIDLNKRRYYSFGINGLA